MLFELHAEKITNRCSRSSASYHCVDFGDILYIYSFAIMIFVRVKAKSLLCYWAVRDLGIGMDQIAGFFNLSLAGVSQSVKRGETIVQQKGYNLIDP